MAEQPEDPIATIGVVPIYESELQGMLDAFGIKTSVVYGPQPSNEMLMKRALEQLALTTRYDYAYWEARYEAAVISAMLHAYIETGEVVVVAPSPGAEMKAPYFNDADGFVRTYRGAPGEILTDTMLVDAIEKPTELRAQPDYLRHDPTKQVHRRRSRKAYGRKGDRP